MPSALHISSMAAARSTFVCKALHAGQGFSKLVEASHNVTCARSSTVHLDPKVHNTSTKTKKISVLFFHGHDNKGKVPALDGRLAAPPTL